MYSKRLESNWKYNPEKEKECVYQKGRIVNTRNSEKGESKRQRLAYNQELFRVNHKAKADRYVSVLKTGA